MTGLVGSYSCPCGARDEVLEPAPQAVDCWSCRRPLSAIRWNPGYDPPRAAARATTGSEELRARRERGEP